MDYTNRLQKSSLERKNRRIGYICLGLAAVLTIVLVCRFFEGTAPLSQSCVF